MRTWYFSRTANSSRANRPCICQKRSFHWLVGLEISLDAYEGNSYVSLVVEYELIYDN